jgi:hypothetical protein
MPLKMLAEMLQRPEEEFKPGAISPTVNILLQVENYQAQKIRHAAARSVPGSSWVSRSQLMIRRRRAKTCFTKKVPVWCEDETSGRLEKQGDELHAYSPALYFSTAADSRRMLKAAIASDDGDLPF